MSARSVVLSTLLGTRPPVLPVRVLVRTGELFGIAEGTVRTALSRMAAAGEVQPDPDQPGTYRLAGRLLERQARQQASFAPEQATKPWRNRHWRFAFVISSAPRSAPDRAGLRDAARTLRMAELREGVWLRPDNLRQPDVPAARATIAAQCVEAVGRLDTADGAEGANGDDAALAARLWDLDGWAAHAEALRAELHLHDIDLALGFVLSAAVLRHLQADPLLPPDLLPADWPGPALRTQYRAWDAAYRTLLSEWWKVPDSSV